MTPGSEWNFEFAQAAFDLGRFEQAITLLEEVTDQGWLSVWPYYWDLLTEARHLTGQYERELQDGASWTVRFPGDVWRGAEIAPLAALGRVDEALALARTPRHFVILISELFAHGHHEAAQGVIRDHLPKVDLTDPNPYNNAHVLFWTGRLTEAEDLLRLQLEEHPDFWRSWALLVEVILAKGDREEAVRISNRVAEVETPAPELKPQGRAKILMLVGDSAGTVEVLRTLVARHRTPDYLHWLFHKFGPVPPTWADYAPLLEPLGWPPPLPN